MEEHAKPTGLDGEAYDAQRNAWRTAAEVFHAALTEYEAHADVGMSQADGGRDPWQDAGHWQGPALFMFGRPPQAPPLQRRQLPIGTFSACSENALTALSGW